MLKQDFSTTLCLKSSTTRAPVCDTCRSRPSTIFCHADLAYLCTACDSHVHAANKLSSRHKRVLVCESCEQAPAALICKADAASLCATCDGVIHSANPLSRRHHRVPVMPVSGWVYGHRAAEPWSVIGPGVESGGGFLSQESEGTLDNEDEDEAASWLVLDSPHKNSQSQNVEANGFLLNGDEYLDLVEYNSCQDTQFSDEFQFEDEYKYISDGTNNIKNQQQRYGGYDADSVVPVHFGEVKKYHQFNFQDQKFHLGMEYDTSNGAFGYPASHGHSVSMSSMEAGTVPELAITEADASISNARNPNATMDLFSGSSIQMPTQLHSVDREARVLRYREKKKTRKFEKTIRYASRKAYAETRPRIKGRFAKRNTNDDVEVDQMLSPNLIIEAGYCIFPSS